LARMREKEQESCRE